jgi:hypothetical protein
MDKIKPKKKTGRPTTEEKDSEVAAEIGRKSQPKERTCLHCKKLFMSQGSHNRLCDPCRKFLQRVG